jgi:hypothetical protein
MDNGVQNKLQVEKRRSEARDFMEDPDLLLSLSQAPGDGVDVLDGSFPPSRLSVETF